MLVAEIVVAFEMLVNGISLLLLEMEMFRFGIEPFVQRIEIVAQ